MALSIVPGSGSPFDSIRHVDEQGNEYWQGRELMPMLGYRRWDRVPDVVDRAKLACVNAGNLVAEHFTDETRKTKGRPQEDYKLSRYACHLIAMNGDPRKVEIAAAQTYFSIKTRQAEIAEQESLQPVATSSETIVPDIQTLLLAIDGVFSGVVDIDSKLVAGLKANEIGKYHPALKPAMEQAKKLLPAPVPDRLVTVTNLAKLYHEQTGKHLANGKDATEAKAMNLLLEKIGLQYRNQDNGEPRWLPTELGKQYASVVLQEALNNNKTVQQLRWQPAVLDTLR